MSSFCDNIKHDRSGAHETNDIDSYFYLVSPQGKGRIQLFNRYHMIFITPYKNLQPFASTGIPVASSVIYT